MSFEKVKIEDIRKIVQDRLDTTSTNISLCAKMGKGMIKVFNSFATRVYSDDPLYAFVPKEAVRHSQGDWEYDISSFKIYKITKEFLNSQGVVKEMLETGDTRAMVSIGLDPELVVYDSSQGAVIADPTEKTSFSLREKACLYLSLPESGTKWLDELIIKKNRNVLLNV